MVNFTHHFFNQDWILVRWTENELLATYQKVRLGQDGRQGSQCHWLMCHWLMCHYVSGYRKIWGNKRYGMRSQTLPCGTMECYLVYSLLCFRRKKSMTHMKDWISGKCGTRRYFFCNFLPMFHTLSSLAHSRKATEQYFKIQGFKLNSLTLVLWTNGATDRSITTIISL